MPDFEAWNLGSSCLNTMKLQALVYDIFWNKVPESDARNLSTSCLNAMKLQALVYNILLEEGAGKRCLECGYVLL